MRQVLQSLSDGQTVLAEVPVPQAGRGRLLVRTTCSLVSAGTERMLIEFGRAGWLERARQQPAAVRQVLEKARTDGVAATLEAVRSRLDEPLQLGYCNVGIVQEVGPDIADFAIGTRVLSNGPHAEWVSVPRHLCARVPEGVADEEAVFAVLGAIALQGIRLANPTLGERFAVIGLGLIGLLAVQLLRANGCAVLGIDPDPQRCALARQFGAEVLVATGTEDILAAADSFSGELGIDGVLITAATASNEPVSQAARMSRKRGRIVLVGVTGLTLERNEFYQKELSFQVSCSYGPGRYEPDYEQRGRDYPAAFVRWTEQRNFGAVLAMMGARQLDVRPLISHRFAFDAAPSAYEMLSRRTESYLGILLDYTPREQTLPAARTLRLNPSQASAVAAAPRVGFIGAGNYASRVLLPAFAASGVQLQAIASSGGVSAANSARKFSVPQASSDAEAVLCDPDIDAVVIATRHDTHAAFVIRALEEGKHVFVEKPLATSIAQIEDIVAAFERAHGAGRPLQLVVGFNRRFAPQVLRMKSLLASVRAPKSLVMMVNAGAVSANHWVQDPDLGGGRILGEACHFVDLLRCLVGHPIVSASVQRLGGAGHGDSVTLTLRFADGSLGTTHYLANGHRSFPKERIEVFCAGRILQLDNFRHLRGYGWPGFARMNLWRQDKGQRALVAAFVAAVRAQGPPPVPFEEIVEVSRTAVELAEAARV
jgi:predicted dehydrogenase